MTSYTTRRAEGVKFERLSVFLRYLYCICEPELPERIRCDRRASPNFQTIMSSLLLLFVRLWRSDLNWPNTARTLHEYRYIQSVVEVESNNRSAWTLCMKQISAAGRALVTGALDDGAH